jgi:hypothetical protein
LRFDLDFDVCGGIVEPCGGGDDVFEEVLVGEERPSANDGMEFMISTLFVRVEDSDVPLQQYSP